MSYYNCDIEIVQRSKGNSVASKLSYICGVTLFDSYKGKKCYKARDDIMYASIIPPKDCPPELLELQALCNAVNEAEKRKDAQTARTFMCSLPNKLSHDDNIRIAKEFIYENFTSKGFIAVLAIHEGENKNDPTKNNPHAHIVVPLRKVDSQGFLKTKDRSHNRKENVREWRESLERSINRKFKERDMHDRVCCKSLEIQGDDREPRHRLSRSDYELEKKGIRTKAGDINREIEKRNIRRIDRDRDIERSR